MTAQKTFEQRIEENESNIIQIRSIFFPLIRDGIITGYNIYDKVPTYSPGKLFLNYLHSDLSPSHQHFQELTKILEQEGLTSNILNIGHELVDSSEIKERHAIYLTKPEWEDAPKMRYFLFDGTEVSQKEAEELGVDLVGEVLQYDMLLKVKNETELRRITDLFKKYVASYRIDDFGRKIKDKDGVPTENTAAIHKSWDIPLLICTSSSNKKPRTLKDFLEINQFDISHRFGNNSVVISTIVRNKSRNLEQFLVTEGLDYEKNKKYVLRIFVEDYINS